MLKVPMLTRETTMRELTVRLPTSSRGLGPLEARTIGEPRRQMTS
jgi:hypothetical protein